MANVPNLPEGLAQFEYQKMQLIGSLSAVADNMRNCAAIADQFAQMVSHVPFNAASLAHSNGYAIAAPPPLASAPAVGKRKSRGTTDDGEKKKKKPRDPNAPKRPASSYLIFQNEVRQELKEKNPTLPNNALLGIISKLWNDMPKEQKESYEQRQKVAKDKWLLEKSIYETANAEGSGAAQAATPAAAAPAVLVAVAAPPVQVTPPAPVVTSSDEEVESSEESSDDSSEAEVEEEEKPQPKKAKKDVAPAPVATPAKAVPVKDKKHKKSKA